MSKIKSMDKKCSYKFLGTNIDYVYFKSGCGNVIKLVQGENYENKECYKCGRGISFDVLCEKEIKGLMDE
jgi:hypothetical protein